MDRDQVIHALAWDDRVRVVAASMTDSVQRAVDIHHCHATAAAAVGRTLIGARLFQASVKDTERITLQVKGTGPIGLIVARALPGGDVYASVAHPEVHLPPRDDGKLDVGTAVGTPGQLMVVRDTDTHAEPYVGVTELVSGEIGDDLAHYLLTSEQIRSAMIVGVMMANDGKVLGAGGLLIQVLGGLEEEELAQLEARIYATQDISWRMSDGASAQDLLYTIGGDDARVLDEKSVQYHCDRGRAYYADTLAALDAATLREIFEDDERIELTCEFTRESFTFERGEFPKIKPEP